MISGRTERPAIGDAVCPEQIGPIWKLSAETCGCVLPATHLDDPRICAANYLEAIAEEGK